MRNDRIPSRSPSVAPKDLLAAARVHFPCLRRGSTRCYVAPRYADAARALGDFDALGELGEAAPHGRSRASNRIVSLSNHVERLHLRPQRRGGALAFLWRDRVGGPKRSLRELEVTRNLRRRGAPVPEPVLAAATRRGVLWSATLGTGYEEDTVDLETRLGEGPSRTWIRRQLRAVGRAVRSFHDHGAEHGDLHAGNIVVRNGGATPAVVIVDLDRTRLLREVGAERRMRDIMRLHRSLLKRGLIDRVGRRGFAAFLAGYTEGDRNLRTRLLAQVPREWRRTRRHRLSWGFPRRSARTR